MEALVEEILKRLPPDEPEHLVRASLVCKPWYRLLYGEGFRSRYRSFHKIPPMLTATFVPTARYSPRDPDHHRTVVLECHHGRVLLGCTDDRGRLCLVVWDPMTGSRMRLGALPSNQKYCSRWATVLCAARGCDHRASHLGPFLVVFITFDTDAPVAARAFVYSSKTSRWSALASLHIGAEAFLEKRPSVLVGDVLHFLTDSVGGFCFLKYDLGNNALSKIDLPLEVANNALSPPVLIMAAENGGLCLVAVDNSSFVLYELSRENGVTAWTQPRVLADLKTLLPAIGDSMVSPKLAA